MGDHTSDSNYAAWIGDRIMLCNLGIYDRIYTGRDHRFNDRDDHDAELYLSPIFIMAFAVCIQTTVWRIRQKNLLDSTFCLGYIRKWSRHAKTRRKLEDEAMSFAEKTCKRQDQTVQGLTIYFNCRYTCLYHHGNEWNEYSIPTLVYSSSHLCFSY